MPPLTVEHLYGITPRVIGSLVGAPCHVRCVVSGELGGEAPGLEAAFLPREPLVVIHPDVAAKERAFCDLEFSSGRLADEAQEGWQLKLLNGSIDSRLHACAHGIGPENLQLARLEWGSYARYPHVAVLAEGVAECVVEELRETYRTEVGLAALDERILDAEPIRHRFAAQAALVRGLCGEIAHALGTTTQHEIFALAADGGGQLAVWRLAMRWSAAQMFEEPEVLAKPGAIVDLRRSLERSLTGLRGDWVEVDGLHGHPDNELGALWGRTAVRDFAETVRRVRAGPGGVPDIGTFVAQLAAAAGAAQSSMEQSLDEVSAALEQLMALGDDPGAG
jgi:hypothetical protein